MRFINSEDDDIDSEDEDAGSQEDGQELSSKAAAKDNQRKTRQMNRQDVVSKVSSKSKDIKKKEKKTKKIEKGSQKWVGKSRPRLELGKLFLQEFYDNELGENLLGFTTYLNVIAKPSSKPQRFFCSVCNTWSKYSCTRCGLRYCSIACGDVHKETTCVKFAE